MWFVFPQIAGLGTSWMSRHYAIGSLAEARAYLTHPVLGARLLECTRLVVATAAGSAEDIFGGIDAAKLRSSMTLFHLADPSQPAFGDALNRYFEGQPDVVTIARLEAMNRTDTSTPSARARTRGRC